MTFPHLVIVSVQRVNTKNILLHKTVWE